MRRTCIAVMIAAVLGWGGLVACEDPPTPTAGENPPSAQPQADVDGPIDPDAPPPPPPAPADLDTMDETELEAACFAGDSQACDRLGH